MHESILRLELLNNLKENFKKVTKIQPISKRDN